MTTQGDNSLVRVQSIEADDDGDQQLFQANGRHKERMGGNQKGKGVPRVQSYGMSCNPPKGSFGMTMGSNGNPDQNMIVGMEHPEVRPKGLKEGEVQMYYKLPKSGMTPQQLAEGEGEVESKVFMQKDQTTIEHTTKIIIKVGESTITIEKEKITIKSARIDLNP
jgi:phage gp45-like